MKPDHELDRFRPVPFYFLDTADPADYTQEAVFAAMKRMKELGYGGIVLFNKPPLGFDADAYLSDFWFTLTERFIQAALLLKLQLWINDGFDYPPGDAAGRIFKQDPTLKQLRLVPNEEGKLFVEEVPWGFPAFEEPESGRYFRKFVYEEYYRRLAKYFGNGITGFFSDADNRRFNAHTLKAFPEQYYPWSRNFGELFFSRFGYRIEKVLAELFHASAGQVRHDYWQLCGELYQSWFAGNYAWCKAHNVLYTFHTSDTGPLAYGSCRRSSAFTEGDPLALLRNSDLPGTDHEILALDGGTHYDGRYRVPEVTLGGGAERLPHPLLNVTLHDVRAKYAASAAFLNGKERVMCEMFAATNWGVTFDDLRRIAAWQVMQGVNFIVPHAVHHRFRGIIKHFAPPEFSHGTLRHGLREFNDLLACWCQAASAGEPCADYAVIDPTEKVWRGADPEPFFRFCDLLNRRGETFVVVPENYDGNIPCVIDPLKEIPDLPAPKVTFTGGEIACMRRKFQGEEFLLVSNLWDPNPVSGILTFRGREYELLLEPGEIAVIGGPFASFRSPEKREKVRTFSGEYAVLWKEPNVIPFDRELRFAAPERMALSLLLPAGHPGKVSLNGKLLSGGRAVKVYDDEYVRYDFTPEKLNTIRLEKETSFTTPALLQGEFDTALETKGDFARKVYQQYSLDIYEPEEAFFILTARRKTLVLSRGWEKQGQLFYSGEALILLGKTETEAGDTLSLPGFHGIAELLLDGKSSAKRSFSPYEFPLPEGEHELSLRIWNSMANRMERYGAPSGLAQFPVIMR